MHVIVLGSGCQNCETLEARTREALGRLGVTATIEHERDPGRIAAWGVLRTPGLVADGEVVVAGRVPTVDQLAALFAPAP